MSGPSCRAILLCLAAGIAGAAGAGPVQQRIADSGVLRVCIWPEYYGITLRDPQTGQLSGIDIELSAELAHDLKVRLQYVDSSFQTVVQDLKADRCDVAMFAIGMLPQRMEHLRFTRPYLRSDIYAVAPRDSKAVQHWEDIDRPGVAVGVQAGTFMEPAMAATLKEARLVVVRPPATRERELAAGRLDVFMTDYPYGLRLMDRADGVRLIAPPQPFFVLPYAYAVKPGDEQWLQTVDDFVDRIQQDGRLQAAAVRNGLKPIVVLK